MDGSAHAFSGSSFRKFFFRGLGIILPTVLTIWLVVIAYTFVKVRIADPINAGVQELVIRLSPWPHATDDDFTEVADRLTSSQQAAWELVNERLAEEYGPAYSRSVQVERRREWMKTQPDIVLAAREIALERWWNSVTIGNWRIMDLIGLIIAIVLIYMVGLFVGSYIGRRLYHRGEELVHRVPLIRRVYPSVKQVTDFFFGGETRVQFSKVVAVEYPRKGIWSVGLVTGETMQRIQDAAGEDCMTVFVPSSPTPFTGYVITVPTRDTIDLPITIEDAIKFAVSGGVLVPPNQQISGQSGLQTANGQPWPLPGEPAAGDRPPGGHARRPDSDHADAPAPDQPDSTAQPSRSSG